MGDEWDNSSTFPAESPAMNSLFSSRYLDPKVDLAFKRIFGEHEHLLRSFLNAMLPLPEGREITQLEYLTPEQVPEIPGLMKYSIVDVKCTDTQGRIFIVEMQMLWIPSFASRIVFAGAQAYVKQLAVGQNYGKLQPVYVLAMINDQFRRDTDEFYHHSPSLMSKPRKKPWKGCNSSWLKSPSSKRPPSAQSACKPCGCVS
jgi:hypothetical protein